MNATWRPAHKWPRVSLMAWHRLWRGMACRRASAGSRERDRSEIAAPSAYLHKHDVDARNLDMQVGWVSCAFDAL